MSENELDEEPVIDLRGETSPSSHNDDPNDPDYVPSGSASEYSPPLDRPIADSIFLRLRASVIPISDDKLTQPKTEWKDSLLVRWSELT
jgi:hypothetical protein